MEDFAVITSYFNFTNNKNFFSNFKAFKDSLSSQGVPLFVVEISDTNFELPDDPNCINLKTNCSLA